jgi:hypothetical protein
MEKEGTTYFLYHIPGQKIGVTKSPYKRITFVQGYKPGEYEILETSQDINYISELEVELQKKFGYKRDRNLYKDLFKKENPMLVNPTNQTSTFPVPVTELKATLNNNVGYEWKTPNGYNFRITDQVIPWIIANAKTSMYNSNRCYIYNKAFYEAHFRPQDQVRTISKEENIFEDIRVWARNRGIYKNGDVKTQYIKLQEEAGELARAIIKEDYGEFVDAIGDCVVVLTNLAELGNKYFETQEGYYEDVVGDGGSRMYFPSTEITIENCIGSAYDVIAKRKGSMKNGSFVKESL